MANISFDGLSEYISSLEKLSGHSEGIAKKALYEGAAVVADDLRAAVNSIPVHVKGNANSGGITAEQKAALARGLGISKFRNDGTINALIGFNGYSDYKTPKYPNGQPLILIARVAESGTSFSRKTPFVKKAIRKAKPVAEAKMKEVFESEIEKLMK